MKQLRTYLIIFIALMLGACEKVDLIADNGESTEGGEGTTVTDTIKAEGWGDTIEEELTLDDNDGNSDDGGNDHYDNNDGGEEYYVSTMPSLGEIYHSHAIVAIDDSGQALLLSNIDYESIPSAYSEEYDPGTAVRIAEVNIEDGMTGWTIPTREEARLLRSLWSTEDDSAIEALNGTLCDHGIPELRYTNTDRYLCEDGTYTFSLAPSTSISKAGTKKTYLLRLVKRVRFSSSK